MLETCFYNSRHVTGHLAELESTAWKDDRRFRVLVADAGALSFADLYLNTPTKVSLHQPSALEARVLCPKGSAAQWHTKRKWQGERLTCSATAVAR